VVPPPDAARDQRRAPAPLLRASLATWLRYVVPLTLLSAVALAPVIALALRVRAPLDQAGAGAAVTVAWEMLGIAWLGQLVLVGGAAAVTCGPGSQASQVSQLRALRTGLVGLARAIVPCLAAAAAISFGCLALVVPGLALVVLLALTGASRQRGVPAALVDSIAVARAQWPAVAIAVASMLALDAAIGFCAHRGFVAGLPRQATPAQLATVRHFVRAIALALVVISPLPATVLAMIRARAES